MIDSNHPPPPPPTVSPTWELCWALSSSSLVLGTLDLPLAGPDHNAEQAFAFSGGSGGGIIENDATLQITAVDPSLVGFQVEETGPIVVDLPPHPLGVTGAYTAVRCP
jgi:hypothetical protein